LDCGKDLAELKISVLGALHSVYKAWQEVKVYAIENCITKAGLCLDTSEVKLQVRETIVLDAEWEKLNSGSTFITFVGLNAELVMC
jgi:hypothetical protein